MDTFWMVYVSGTEGTRKRYEVYQDAVTEAERLARQTGKPVFMMEAVGVCETSSAPVVWKRTVATKGDA